MRRRNRGGLSPRDEGVLELEARWGAASSTQERKYEEARRTLGLSPGGYALVLKALIDDPAAYAHDPATVERLRAARAKGAGDPARPLS